VARAHVTTLLRNFADAASPWEQVGSGDPNVQPEVRACYLLLQDSADSRQNFKIPPPPPPPKEEKKDEKK